MGGDVGKHVERKEAAAQRRSSQGFLSSVGVALAHRLAHSAVFSRPVGADEAPSGPGLPPHSDGGAETSEQTPPASVALFLPEFPQRHFPGPDRFQVLSFIARGSYGPVLKVRDVSEDKTFAVKVLLKSSIVKEGALQQSKEEVIIQRQLKHPFIHKLQDCWQTQRHLFIMWDFCGGGDLYTSWLLRGRFEEDEVRLLAAELASALGFLHDLGIMHRDVKMENVLLNDRGHLRLSDFGLSRRLKRGGRAFTICGTIQYMAPEVLAGGPYCHSADWWSLGVLLFALAAGEFPLAAEPDHSNMLKKVIDCLYDPPATFSSALASLLTELLCKTPLSRLRHLDCLKTRAFFRGASFDSYILQKTPVHFILELRSRPDWADKSRRGAAVEHFDHFDCDQILQSPTTPSGPFPTLTGRDLKS